MEQKRKIFWIALLSITVLFLTNRVLPAGAISEKIEAQYLSTLTNGAISSRILVAKKITQSHIEDDNIFLELEKQIKEGYKVYHNDESQADRDKVDMLAWFCKALASSGKDKYRPTLYQVATGARDPKLKHYAQQSLDTIVFHKKRNRILAQSQDYINQGFDPESARLVVMLKSDELSLKRDAAKKIVRGVFVDPRVFDAVASELQREMKNEADNLHNKIYIDTMSWMCKALGVSGSSKYAMVLYGIFSESSSPKIKQYAEKSWNACKNK